MVSKPPFDCRANNSIARLDDQGGFRCRRPFRPSPRIVAPTIHTAYAILTKDECPYVLRPPASLIGWMQISSALRIETVFNRIDLKAAVLAVTWNARRALPTVAARRRPRKEHGLSRQRLRGGGLCDRPGRRPGDRPVQNQRQPARQCRR